MQHSARASILVVLFVAVAGVPLAHAQNGAFAGGLAGITFASETSSVFAGQAGGRVARQLFVFGEFGRMQNVLPEEAQDDLDDATEFLESQLGTTVDLDVRVPAIYGLAGIRWSPEDRIAPRPPGCRLSLQPCLHRRPDGQRQYGICGAEVLVLSEEGRAEGVTRSFGPFPYRTATMMKSADITGSQR